MKNKKRVLIVGGVAGGASAAARARRLSEDSQIILFERGQHISFANCGLPYHIGGEIVERGKLLVQTPQNMNSRFNIDVRVNSDVVKIDRKNKTVTVHDEVKDEVYDEAYDELILSPGAQAVKPPIPGIDNEKVFTLRNIADMDLINNFISAHKAKCAVVVGGGYIGLEMAEALRRRDLQVDLVELADQVMGPIDKEMASLLHQELRLNSVNTRLGVSVSEFCETKNGLEIILSNNDNILTDMVILAIGVKPEVVLAKDAGLKIGELGGIVVDRYMRTNDAHIYAVGDAVEVREFVSGKSALIPLAGPANRQGRIAADNIFDRRVSYNATQGSGVCKVFNQAVGMTGLNEKLLKRFEIHFEKIYIHPAQHAGYYPGATPISFKLLFDPENGKILGAQAVGVSGVAKRIDIVAMAIRSGQTVFDLQEAELCYAPPYGSAKDVVNYAGFVAANVINKDVRIFHVSDIDSYDTKRQFLLDVRTADEYEMGAIDGATNIPVDELRARLGEIPKGRELLVYCKVGLRGYVACRILQQRGFNCSNLSGGYMTYQMVNGDFHEIKISNAVCSDSGDACQEGDDLPFNVVRHIDARGLQCPGPIQKIKKALDGVSIGDVISITTTDPGFVNDAPAWCQSAGHKLVDIAAENGVYVTTIKKDVGITVKTISNTDTPCRKTMTIVLFSGDFDKAMAAFIIANGAATMGYEVTVFSTFWGLNVLRRDNPVKVEKGFIERMFEVMMPRGANKIVLSKMHMLGMGTKMIKGIMNKKKIASLPELIESAKEAKVHLVACSMTMGLMGIKHEELIDGVETGGVAMYLNQAGNGGINLFI